MLDNEAPDLHKDAIAEGDSKYQIILPNNHRSNDADQAIRTFKEDFLCILIRVDAKIIIPMWDHLIEQAIITVKILLQSKVHPHLSS